MRLSFFVFENFSDIFLREEGTRILRSIPRECKQAKVSSQCLYVP